MSVVALVCGPTDRDVAAVFQVSRPRGGQRQPRTAVDDTGRPQTENDAASSAHRVGCLGAHRMTDCDVPEPPHVYVAIKLR